MSETTVVVVSPNETAEDVSRETVIEDDVSRETVDHAVDHAVEMERRLAAIEARLQELAAQQLTSAVDVVETAREIAQDVAESVAADVAEAVAEDTANDVAEVVAEDVTEDVAEAASEDPPEDVSPHRKNHWYSRPLREWRSGE